MERLIQILEVAGKLRQVLGVGLWALLFSALGSLLAVRLLQMSGHIEQPSVFKYVFLFCCLLVMLVGMGKFWKALKRM